ncbi:MAG: hypothetical protein KGI08_08145, partial [Thaumarchaeota archaeon]|nr:hypothetical protein [Nitrososphaerota archaeon]
MKFVRAHRGLSSVITTAILLTSVAVLGSSIVAWSNGNLKTFETSLINTSSNMTNKINENLNIENVAFCTNCGSANSKNIINVTLTNTGTVAAKITSMQVNSTAISSYLSMSTAL